MSGSRPLHHGVMYSYEPDKCEACGHTLMQPIDWSKRGYLLGDAVTPAPEPDIGNEPGPFRIRMRDLQGNLSSVRFLHEFKTRGEAQEFCDWMNRLLPWIYHYPSKRVLEEP